MHLDWNPTLRLGFLDYTLSKSVAFLEVYIAVVGTNLPYESWIEGSC